MEMKCPERKEIINQKRKESENSPKTHKEAITKNTVAAQLTISQTPDTTDTLNFFSCMMHAHLLNIGSPGSYNYELKKIFKLNNLPEIKMPEEPNSYKIIGAFASAESISHPQHQETEVTREEEKEKENEQRRGQLNKKENETSQAK